MSAITTTSAPDTVTAPWRDVATLRPVAPFAWEQTLAFVGGFGPTAPEQIVTDDTIKRGFLIEGEPVAISVAAAGDDALRLSAATLVPLTAAAQHALIDRVTFWLSLDDDLGPFYASAAGDPPFAAAVAQLHGLHQVKFPTPFEAAAWAVLSQRTQFPTARQHKRALAATCGATVSIDGRSLLVFPEPEAIAGASPDALFAAVRNERQVRYLLAVAAAFAGIDEDFLRTAPVPNVQRWLTAIPGIGEWSAGLVLVRGLGRTEQLPGEMRLQQAVDQVYGTAGADVPALAARYAGYAGYWAYYLRQMLV